MTDGRHDLDAIEAALADMPSATFKARLRSHLEQRVRESLEGSDMTSGLLTAHGARPGFTAVTPYARVQDIERLIAFAKEVFAAEEVERSQGSAGGIHCELRIGDSMVMVGGGAPPDATGRLLPARSVALHVYVDDVDAAYQRALDAGAESLGAPYDTHYGERAGFVKDPTGNEWYIATHTGPSYSSEGLRTVTPSLRGPDASTFIAFLETALGARVEMRADDPQGVVRHAVLRIEGAAIELGEAHTPGGGLRTGMYLYVADCDALYRRAVAAGAKALHPPANMSYGDRMGAIEDAWGNEWYIASHLLT
jgi:PhnB protein